MHHSHSLPPTQHPIPHHAGQSYNQHHHQHPDGEQSYGHPAVGFKWPTSEGEEYEGVGDMIDDEDDISPSSSPPNGYPIVEPYPPPSNPSSGSYPPNTYPPDPYHTASIPEPPHSRTRPSDPSQPLPSVPVTSDAQKLNPEAEEDDGAASDPSLDAEAVLDWAEARELEIARLEAENARLRAELNINPAALRKAGIPDDPEAYIVATSSFGSLGGHNFHGHGSRSSSFSGGGHQNGVFVTASFPPKVYGALQHTRSFSG